MNQTMPLGGLRLIDETLQIAPGAKLAHHVVKRTR